MPFMNDGWFPPPLVPAVEVACFVEDGVGVGFNELESLVVVVGGAPSRFATGEEAAAAVVVAGLVTQRPPLLLRRMEPRGTGARSESRAAATARWWLTLRIAWGVVRADTENARKNRAKHLLIEGIATI